MADNKKYYYLKLKEGFFDSEETLLLESMPDGYLYSNILLKLYLRSLKNEGRLMFNDRIPYNAQMLASVTRHQIGTVERALQIFQQMGLIEVMDSGAIYMLDIQNFIGLSSTEADRKREYRAKIEQEKNSAQALPGGQMSGQMSGQTDDISPPEIEIDIELERELDLETELEKKLEKKLETEPKKKGKAPAKAVDPAHVPNFDETTFSDAMVEKVEEWLQYKKERREAYKPTGLKSLISEIQNNVNRYGEKPVMELIGKCMAAGYRGIIFDKLNGLPEVRRAERPEQQTMPETTNVFARLMQQGGNER